MELTGYSFTWEKNHGLPNWVEERLDRAFVSMNWLEMFSTAKLYNLELSSSDHFPILLVPVYTEPNVIVNRFRFENCWVEEPMCGEIVKGCWNLHSDLDIQSKIRLCGVELAKWGKEYKGKFKERMKNCKVAVKQLKGRTDVVGVIKYNEAHSEFFRLLNHREIYWKQIAKQFWLREGDQNSKYFHASVNARRRNNQISCLENSNGVWVGWKDGLEQVMQQYFQNIFLASDTDWKEVVDSIVPSISSRQNGALLQPISDKEVKEAFFHMHPGDTRSGWVEPGFLS